MAAVVAGYDPEVLVSSDLARARETAAFLEKATGLTCVEDPRLREYDVGERTGLTREEFAENGGGEASWDVHAHVDVPGAETAEQVSARIVPAVRSVLAPLQTGGHRRRRDPRRQRAGRRLRAARLAPGGLRHARHASTTAGGWSSRRAGRAGCVSRRTTSPSPISLACGHWLGFRGVAREGDTRLRPVRGCGAVGSALAWHARGQGFESPQLHPLTHPSGGRFTRLAATLVHASAGPSLGARSRTPSERDCGCDGFVDYHRMADRLLVPGTVRTRQRGAPTQGGLRGRGPLQAVLVLVRAGRDRAQLHGHHRLGRLPDRDQSQPRQGRRPKALLGPFPGSTGQILSRTTIDVDLGTGLGRRALDWHSKPAACSACNGRGKSDCGACQGRGHVTNAAYASAAVGSDDWCSRCSGSGSITCASCSGRGTR